MLTSNFAPLTCMENQKNLEGSGKLWISSRGVNSRSFVIFMVNKDLGILLFQYESIRHLGPQHIDEMS